MTFFFGGNDAQKHDFPRDDTSIDSITGDLSGGIDDLINDLEAEEQTLIKRTKDKPESSLDS